MQQLFRKKIYIFDVDNTLINWSSTKTRFHDLSYSFEMKKAQQQLNQQRGLRNRPPIQLPLCAPFSIHPEILDFWTHLRKHKHPIVIFSDLSHFELHAIFSTSQIQLIINGQDIGANKPLSDGLWQCASLYGVPTSDLIFIGDQDRTDFRSAISAGAQYCDIEELKRLGWREFYQRVT